jgi:hypothetical protein
MEDEDHDFDARVVELFDFWMLFGDYEVTLDYPGGLGVWLSRQRVRLAGHPVDLRYQRLEMIECVIETWQFNYDRLLRFQEEFEYISVLRGMG